MGALLVAFALLPPRLTGDDATRAVALRQLADGVMPDTKYSLIQPLVSVPVYWVLDRIGLGIRAVTLLPILWLAIWCAVVWRLVGRRRGERETSHLLVLTLVSLLAAHVVGFSADLFGALAISGGLLAGTLAGSAPARMAGWGVLVVGVANNPALLVAATVIAIVLVHHRRRLRYLGLVAAAAALVAAEASWSTGSLALTKYDTASERGTVELLPWGEVAGFRWPIWFGLLAVLFSFGRGLVFYLPLWVAGPPRTEGDELTRAEAALWLATAALIPLYATWWAWYGGVGFGPRFFVLGTVPVALAAARQLERADRSTLRSIILAGAVLLSAWVAVVGAVGMTSGAFEVCTGAGTFELEPLCWYSPEYSSLWAPLWDTPALGARHVVFIAVVVAAVLPPLVAAAAPLPQVLAAAARAGARSLRGPWRL